IAILQNYGRHVWNVERRRQDIFGEARRAGMALVELVVLHKALTERLDDAALDLTFDAAGIYSAANIMHRPDAKHLHLAGDGVDLNFGDLAAEDIGLPGTTGAIDRIEPGGVGAERRRADRNHAAVLGDVHGFAHRDAMVGAFSPDLAVGGADRIGFYAPIF